MHDIRAIRETPETYVRGWGLRGVEDPAGLVAELVRLDGELRAAQTAGQDAQARRNALSKAIGQAKGRRDEAEAARLLAEVEALKGAGAEAAEAERTQGEQLRERLAALPNLAAGDVPEGADESGNVRLKVWGGGGDASLVLRQAQDEGRLRGEASSNPGVGSDDQAQAPTPRPELVEGREAFTPRDHVDLGEALGLMDFEAAARMSGARFVVLKGQLARLERALAQFMLDLQTTEHGYTEVSPPVLVRDEALFGTGQLPKFAEDLFRTGNINFDQYRSDFLINLRHLQDRRAKDDAEQLRRAAEEAPASVNQEEYLHGFAQTLHSEIAGQVVESLRSKVESGGYEDKRWLIPTAEVSLTNLVREQITPAEQLPLRLTACTPCFRAEAGASGRDTRGMIRQHQFLKVELVSITAPEDSEAEHERMTACAEAVLERLELPYRRMLLCAGDMGFSARKTFDLEVWLPSQGTFREISSCSNCGDFQARRMDARFKRAGAKGTEFVHTLNGSGLAVGRTLVAVMENYQDEGGRIAVPEALRGYMGGLTHIGGEG